MPIELPAALAPVAQRLSAMLEKDSLPHALLLEGASQFSRREAALALARALLCEQEAGCRGQDAGETEMFGGASLFGGEAPAERAIALPCENCPHCVKTHLNVHPDLRLAEGGAGVRSFHIDAIRSLRQDACILPNEAERKVYVLHNAQSMTVEAQNALLKLLEEPPGYVCLILTAPARKMLLQTVISRVAALSLGEAAEEALDAQREALLRDHAARIAQALVGSKSPYALLEATAPLEGDKDLVREILPAIRRALHAMLVKDTGDAARVLSLTDGLRELEFALERNANLNLLVTRLAALGVYQ